MKLTNNLNLPQPIVDAVKNDGYSKGDADISVTTLLKPPRVVALERKHWDELEEDASDRIWSLLGQVVHGILERSNTDGLAEHRLYTDCLGWRVSGQVDLYTNGMLQDYKFVTGYKFKNGAAPEEYVQQLNLYAHMLRVNGHEVKAISLVGIIRDWSKLEAARDPSYPQKQVIVIEIPVWPEAKAREFMEGRVKLHQAAKDNLPECTEAERWTKPSVFAVMKQGRKSAVKLHDTEEAANQHASTDASLSVVHRPGVNTRCENYCSVCKHCTQFQTLKKQTEGE